MIRISALAGAALALAQIASPAPTPAAQTTAQTCPPPAVFTPDLTRLSGYHVFTGPDGDAKVEPMTIDARDVSLMKTGKTLHIFDLPTAPKRGVQMVVGPANMVLPLHPSPYKELFILLSGSTTLITKSFKAQITPGMVMLLDDMTARFGHGGQTGPCGYVAFSIQP